MARNGVTQQDINAAADALLVAGERPTTERVRGALGRGSPNTIAPLLDGWWADLGQRLAQRLVLPAVPDEVSAAFAQVWEAALAAGKAHAEAAIAPERAALADVIATVEARVVAERDLAAAAEARRQNAVAAAQTAEGTLAISELRAADLVHQNAALQAQVQDLATRRDALETRLQAAQFQAEAGSAAAAAERESLQAHLRQVEDRAYGEVDRTRQELKSAKAQLATQAREHAAALRTSEQARRGAETALAKAERDISTLQGRLELATAKTLSAITKKTVRSPSRGTKV